MTVRLRTRRVSGAILLLAAVLAAAGGLHNHADLARIAAAGFGANPGHNHRVVSSHSPLEKSSHWHSVIRGQDHACLACHLHRFAAVAARAHGAAPTDVGLFASHESLLAASLAFRLGDPTRGPPRVS
jgi:hypothetical protein